MGQDIADVLGETATGLDPATPFDGNLPGVGASYKPFSFTGKRVLLDRLAQRALPVVSKTGFSPVLKNFLIKVKKDSLSVTATDGVLSIIATTPAVIADLGSYGESVQVAIPARRLVEILKEAPEGDVTIAVEGDNATVTAGHASWVLHLGSDSTEFPKVWSETAELHEVPRKPLLDALQTVKYAVSKTSQELAQIAIAPDAKGVMCATASDRTRFARVRLAGFPLPMRIPTVSGAADQLIRLLSGSENETIQVADTGIRLAFVVGSATLIAAKLGKEFPDLEKQLLEPVLANQDALTADKAELTDALRRVRINADETTSALAIQLAPGRLTLVSQDKARNAASEAIPAGWDGPERQLVVNHTFLAELLAACPAPSCLFRLGKDTGKRRAAILLEDVTSGSLGIINQMSVSSLVGF